MDPIRVGDIGRGVEDIQRRLASLGYDFGAHGVDGDFRAETQAAVAAFQRDHGLEPAGEVDTHTWSALVDSTFVFGDRSLYLRAPHFHGQDVLTIQRALNSLGFPCGALDSIFGPATERAVMVFQGNVEINPDGIVGAATYDQLRGLRHIWDGRDAQAHSAATIATQQRERALTGHDWMFISTCDDTRQVVRRLENLALASTPEAQVSTAHLPALPARRDNFSVTFSASKRDNARVPRRDSMETSAPSDIAEIHSRSELVQRVVIPTGTSSERRVLAQGIVAYIPNRADLAASIAFAEMPLTICLSPEHLASTDKLRYQYIAATTLDALCAVFE